MSNRKLKGVLTSGAFHFQGKDFRSLRNCAATWLDYPAWKYSTPEMLVNFPASDDRVGKYVWICNLNK